MPALNLRAIGKWTIIKALIRISRIFFNCCQQPYMHRYAWFCNSDNSQSPESIDVFMPCLVLIITYDKPIPADENSPFRTNYFRVGYTVLKNSRWPYQTLLTAGCLFRQRSVLITYRDDNTAPDNTKRNKSSFNYAKAIHWWRIWTKSCIHVNKSGIIVILPIEV